jgi:hypothetical protein
MTEKVVTRLSAKFVPSNRPMDNIAVDWDSPQEDDVALCIMSQVSPINLISHPHDQSMFSRPLDFDKLPADDLQRWKDALFLLIQKLTYVSGRRIMMKSPFHLYHIPTLLEMYPDARILFIHRNPYNVFRSTMHLRRRMIEENTLGRMTMEGSEESVIDSYRFGFEQYQKHKQLIPPEHHHELCYEELEQNPIGVLKDAYEGLDLPGFEQLEQTLLPEVDSLKRYQKNVFDDDPFWVNRVYEELRDIFDCFGYSRPEVVSDQVSEGVSSEPNAAST